MKGLLLSLALSLALHGAAASFLFGGRVGDEGGAGAGGRSSAVSVPAAAEVAKLVDRWERIPDIQKDAGEAQKAPQTSEPWVPPTSESKVLAATPPVLEPVSESAAPARVALANFALSDMPAPARMPVTLPESTFADMPVRAEGGVRPPDAAADRAPDRVEPPAPVRRSAAPAVVSRGEGGLSGAGSVGAGAGGTERAETAWAGQIRGRIAAHHRVPREVMRAGISGRAVVRITVRPDGQLSDIMLVRSSGHALLDRAAIGNVRRAGRMPSAPPGVSRALTVDVPLNFELG